MHTQSMTMMHLVCSCDGCTEASVASPQLASQSHTKRGLPGIRPETEVESVEQEDPEEWRAEHSDRSRWKKSKKGQESCRGTAGARSID